MTFNTPVAYSFFEMNGGSQTLAGINSDPWATIETRYDNTGLNIDSLLTINNTTNCNIPGSDPRQGSGNRHCPDHLVENGPGTLVLTNNRQRLHRWNVRQRRHAANRHRRH